SELRQRWGSGEYQENAPRRRPKDPGRRKREDREINRRRDPDRCRLHPEGSRRRQIQGRLKQAFALLRTMEMRRSTLLLVLSVLSGCGRTNSVPNTDGHTAGAQSAHQASGESDRKVVLEAVLRDLLTHPEHHRAIDSYGVPGAKECALAIDSK